MPMMVTLNQALPHSKRDPHLRIEAHSDYLILTAKESEAQAPASIENEGFFICCTAICSRSFNLSRAVER